MIATRSRIFIALLVPFLLAVFVLVVTYYLSVQQGASQFIIEYRVFRALYSMLAGAVLAASGCFLQSSLRNPLVDHYILGVGSGAVFSTYISIVLSGYNPLTASLAAVLGGLAALALTISIAEKLSGSEVAYVLSGIGVTTLFSGLSVVASYYAVARYPYATLLLVGSFTTSRRALLYYVLAPMLLATAGYFYLSKKLNTLVLGDDYAKQLGVDPRLTRLTSSLIAGASSSIVVGLFGLIGFVGLIAPHISRLLLKTSDNRLVAPVSALVGMLLLFATDQFSRAIAAPMWGELPAGAIVSAFGAPFFLALLVSRLSVRKT